MSRFRRTRPANVVSFQLKEPSFLEQHFVVELNATRNGVLGLPPEQRRDEARRNVKMLLVPVDPSQTIFDRMIPDCLVSESMVDRYLEITPPVMAVVPEFQEIIKEIERVYVRGDLFSALSAACVSIERLLNLARISLHKHHPKVKGLWRKGPSDKWGENIEALMQWGYLDRAFADELQSIFKDVRCRYLHSARIADLRGDALRSVNAAYCLLTIFLGFPGDLFRLTGALNAQTPQIHALSSSTFRNCAALRHSPTGASQVTGST